MKELEFLVNEKLETLDFNKRDLKLCVACSAGVDSTVLFHLLQKISQEKTCLSLAICHVNYGLRGEDSEGDELFLRELADKFKLPFFCFKPERSKKVHEEKIGVQAWARQERYAFFEELASTGWQVALAHTKDDLLETVLQRLLRGTSPLAARGMSERHKFYWRPLLSVEKANLRKWAEKKKTPWREDVSNASRDYSRNKLRLDVIPELESLYPGSSARVIRFAEQSHELAVFTKEALKKRAENYLEKGESFLAIPLEFFDGLTNGVVSLFLAEVLRDFAGESYVPEDKLLRVLYNWILESPKEKPRRQLTQDMFCKIQKNRLIFEKL